MLRRWIAAALSQFRLFGRYPNDNAENYPDDGEGNDIDFCMNAHDR